MANSVKSENRRTIHFEDGRIVTMIETTERNETGEIIAVHSRPETPMVLKGDDNPAPVKDEKGQ